MEITIVEKKTGKVVGRYPVILQGLNYAPSQEEYIAEAWRSAVQDKVVEANARAQYVFQVRE